MALVGCSAAVTAQQDESTLVTSSPISAAPDSITPSAPQTLPASDEAEQGVGDEASEEIESRAEDKDEANDSPVTQEGALASVPSSDGQICDWLSAATFTNGDATLVFNTAASHAEMSEDDWVDAVNLSCEGNDFVSTNADDYDYGFVLRVVDDRLVVETSEFGTLTASSITTFEEATTAPILSDPDRQAVMDAGLEIVRAMIDSDTNAFVDLHADEVLRFASPGEFWSEEEFVTQRSPIGGDYDSFTMDDYLAHYEPRVMTLEELRDAPDPRGSGSSEWAAQIMEVLPDENVLVFNGETVKPGAAGFFQFFRGGIIQFAFVETDDGWRIAGY